VDCLVEMGTMDMAAPGVHHLGGLGPLDLVPAPVLATKVPALVLPVGDKDCFNSIASSRALLASILSNPTPSFSPLRYGIVMQRSHQPDHALSSILSFTAYITGLPTPSNAETPAPKGIVGTNGTPVWRADPRSIQTQEICMPKTMPLRRRYQKSRISNPPAQQANVLSQNSHR
jgi:hypothetical protein